VILRLLFHTAFVFFICVTSLVAQAPELLLFGGPDQDVFLGCLNCRPFNPESICNRSKDYGSRYSSTSIWNRHSDYGSRYSSNSPWNQHASDPPAIIDRKGNFYGYMTASRFHAQRTRSPLLLQLLDSNLVGNDLWEARDWFCRN